MTLFKTLSALFAITLGAFSAAALDLSKATIVVGAQGEVLETATTVLVEEVKRRTGIALPVSKALTQAGPAIYLTSEMDAGSASKAFPDLGVSLPAEPESYVLVSTEGHVYIHGIDASGVLYGVGRLLRNLDWGPDMLSLVKPLNISTSPDDTIRGHQLGYRTTANSYDAWSPEQYDQYIRELAVFGVNAIENIPFQDDASPHFKVTREEMNRALGESCKKYGVAYWVWTPATVDLTNAEERAAHLKEHEAFYQNTPNLDAIFFPGGDPGHNHPKDVLPFLEDISKLLAKYHPEAEIWMSLQGFDDERAYGIARVSMTAWPRVDDPLDAAVVDRAVELYRQCRRSAVTVRSTVDCLIAASALRHGLIIVHCDRDFDAIARVTGLRHLDISPRLRRHKN